MFDQSLHCMANNAKAASSWVRTVTLVVDRHAHSTNVSRRAGSTSPGKAPSCLRTCI